MSCFIDLPTSPIRELPEASRRTQCRRPAKRITIPVLRFLRTRPRVSFLPGEALGAVSESFAARLRRLRTEHGLSVVQLALAVGASEGTIRQLETGNVKAPNLLLGLRLAEQLNVDVRYLAFGEGVTNAERFDAIERRLAKLENRVASLPTRR